MVAVQRVATTVIAVAGPEAAACVAALGRRPTCGPWCRTSRTHRWTGRWPRGERRSARTSRGWCTTPTRSRAVADVWAATFDQQAGRGPLEVAVAEAIARWRARSVELPDYYLVLDPESWPATRRHFHLGFLHRAAPHRVVPATRATAAATIAHLRAGRWWPDLDRLLADVDQVVPDRVGTEPPPPATPQLVH